MSNFILFDTKRDPESTDNKKGGASSDFGLREPILASFPNSMPQSDNLSKMNFTISQ